MAESRLYRYLVAGEMITYAENSPKIIKRSRLEEVVLACNGEAAIDRLHGIFIRDYWKDNTDLDDVAYKCLGPADIGVAVTLDSYVPSLNDTVTVGELIEFLGNNFEADSKLYLVDTSGKEPVYGGIDIDSFGYIAEEE